MLKLILAISTLLLMTITYGQNNNRLELDLIGRYDKQADYITRFGDRSYTNGTKLWGKSFGFNINYIHTFYKYLNATIGVGYYNLGIDKIRQTTPFNIVATGRNINYQHPSGIFPLFGTNKYHYDNFNFTLGLVYEKAIAPKVNLIAGGDFNYLYTFSQLYHITYGDIQYRTHNGRTLGYAVNSYFALLQKFHSNKYYISPKVIVPIYQQLHGDEAFGEERSIKMEKCFNSIGLCFAIGRYL